MNDLQVCNVNFGNYFTSLPSLPCQYQEIIESYQPTYQIYHKIVLKFELFFMNLVGNFKRVRLLEKGHLLQKIQYQPLAPYFEIF